MATQIGLVRRLDTKEVIRIVYPLDHEDDSVLDDPQWVTHGFEQADWGVEMIKVPKDDPRVGGFAEGVMGTPKVL